MAEKWHEVKQVVSNSSVPTETVESILAAMEYLEDVFGLDFLNNLVNPGHPLAHTFLLNEAAWTGEWILWFADSVRGLCSHYNMEEVLRKLKRKKDFREGMSLLRISSVLTQAHCELAFEPTIESGKKPDLLCTFPTKDKALIEVTCIASRRADDLRQRALMLIPFALRGLGNDYDISSKFMRTPKDDELQKLLDKLREFRSELEQSDDFVEKTYLELIDIAGQRRPSSKKMKEWCHERRIEVNTHQISEDTPKEHFKRILNKVRKKQKQVKGDIPGIVVLQDSRFTCLEAGLIHERSNVLREELRKYNHVVCFVIYGTKYSTDEQFVNISNSHIYAIRHTAGLEKEAWVIIPNSGSEWGESKCFTNQILKTVSSS